LVFREGAVEATDDPRVVLREAVTLMRQGQYAESLHKHLWFHDHALEHTPALAGVRLSFALAYWLELAACYPEALRALTAVRDKKARALTDGEGSCALFHDVAAINGYLHEEPATVALFKRLHQADPGLARRCYPVAEKFLVAHQEYAVCVAHLPDPLARFAEARALREVQLELAGENPALGQSPLGDYAEVHFAEAVRRLIAILVGAGRRQDAERVRELALAASASDTVRAALDGALPQQDPGP
jgi:hypothetical protein